MNLKKYYMTLLSNQALIDLIGENKVMSAYPEEVNTFPLVIFEDMNSFDVAFSDNLPEGTSAQVRIHIFSKTLKNYKKVEVIADCIHNIFRNDFWACVGNQEVADVSENVKHRVMDFRREFYSV